MTSATHSSQGLTFAEVNAKIQNPQWNVNPLHTFTAEDLKKLNQILYKFTHFDKEDLIDGKMGRHALAPVAIVFQILWKHPDLNDVRPENIGSLSNELFYMALKYFHTFVKNGIPIKNNEAHNNDAFHLLLEQYRVLLSSQLPLTDDLCSHVR